MVHALHFWSLQKWHQSIYNYLCIHKGSETIICRCFQHLPVKSAIFKNKTNACAFCFCPGFPRLFVSDTSPKRIHREGLGESRTGTGAILFWTDITYKTPIGVNAGGRPTVKTSFIPFARLADRKTA